MFPFIRTQPVYREKCDAGLAVVGDIFRASAPEMYTGLASHLKQTLVYPSEMWELVFDSMVGHPDDRVREASAIFLVITGFGPPDWVKPGAQILRALQDRVPCVRYVALGGLRRRWSPLSPDHICQFRRLIGDETHRIRDQALSLLRELGKDLAGAAIPELVSSLEHPDPAFRSEIFDTLGWLGKEA